MSSLAKVLMKKPKKETRKQMPHMPDLTKDTIHQSDLLYMPDDGGYKYILVVVDVGTRITDAEPIKERSSKNVRSAFEKIYKRNILNMPEQINVDDGSEFKDEVKKYFKSNNVYVKVAKVGRHRQQGVVENRNRIISKILFERMVEEELQTGIQANQWKGDLKDVIKGINEKTKKKKKKDRKLWTCEGTDCEMLSLGDMVRVQLDYPRDTFGKRLHGTKFRETDIRWTIKPSKITNILLDKYQPPLYVLDNDDTTAYTKQQLMPFKETTLSEDKIRPHNIDGKDKYYVEKIIGSKMVRGKKYYEVKWKGFKDTTTEPRSELIKDIKDIIEEYESTNE